MPANKSKTKITEKKKKAENPTLSGDDNDEPDIPVAGLSNEHLDPNHHLPTAKAMPDTTISPNDDVMMVEMDDESIINFHEKEVHDGLAKLKHTNRVFIRKNEDHAKRFDILDDSGVLIYRIRDISKELGLKHINFCLMAADGKKQLLMLQGNPGFLGLNGELIARYPGSLPGDQELIFGSVQHVIRRLFWCNPTMDCRIKDRNGKVLYELLDKNPLHVLNPMRKCSPAEHELVKPGKSLPVIYARIEERRPSEPIRPIIFGKSSDASVVSDMSGGAPVAKMSSSSNGSGGVGTGLKRKSIGSSPMIGAGTIVHQNDKRTSVASQGHGGKHGKRPSHGARRSSISTVKVTKHADHTSFCIGFKPELSLKVRALLITAHILLNHDFIGEPTCTRFVFSITFISVSVIVIIGILIAVVILSMYVL